MKGKILPQSRSFKPMFLTNLAAADKIPGFMVFTGRERARTW